MLLLHELKKSNKSLQTLEERMHSLEESVSSSSCTKGKRKSFPPPSADVRVCFSLKHKFSTCIEFTCTLERS